MVWMNNGDVLSGEITKLEAGKLSLKTKSAAAFVTAFTQLASPLNSLREIFIEQDIASSLAGFATGSLRLLSSVFMAGLTAWFLTRMQLAPRAMVRETYIVLSRKVPFALVSKASRAHITIEVS